MWCPANIEMLKAMWRVGMTATEIAIAMSSRLGLLVTRSSVLGKLYRMGWGNRSRESGEAMPRKTASPRKKPTLEKISPPRVVMRRVKPEPAFEATEVTDLVEPLPDTAKFKPLLELAEGECRWPSGNLPDIRFCGARAVKMTSVKGDPVRYAPYCKHHLPIAWRPTRRQEETR